ncbi:MAG: hypothetical protein DMF53_29320 [Acidobacteria bacterium]|nr:MAG: hypothetical protein DMF53_29320 [Acidobacteriota bacterium]
MPEVSRAQAPGSVQDAYWYENGRWQRFELAPTGSASTTGGITAVSRIANSMGGVVGRCQRLSAECLLVCLTRRIC